MIVVLFVYDVLRLVLLLESPLLVPGVVVDALLRRLLVDDVLVVLEGSPPALPLLLLGRIASVVGVVVLTAAEPLRSVQEFLVGLADVVAVQIQALVRAEVVESIVVVVFLVLVRHSCIVKQANYKG